MHFLIIKGEPSQAVLKAQQLSVDIMLLPSSNTETYAYTTANWKPVSNWFLEDFAHKAPFADGSLLWYRDLAEVTHQKPLLPGAPLSWVSVQS